MLIEMLFVALVILLVTLHLSIYVLLRVITYYNDRWELFYKEAEDALANDKPSVASIFNIQSHQVTTTAGALIELRECLLKILVRAYGFLIGVCFVVIVARAFGLY